MDIERIYSSESELISALKSDLVPFRNDVVKKLKEFYGLGDDV
ncbi:MAG TPA: hypothetical protein VMX55_04060 [candidate division Zixibacteria bacterium]|nr:hypothetical protein [candidate division Zixibacteria bacterium]